MDEEVSGHQQVGEKVDRGQQVGEEEKVGIIW